MVIGVTGGIATGKSSFCGILRRLRPRAIFFDADQAARDLTTNTPEVLAEIRREFGDAVFVETGELNRAALRSIVFGDAARKAALENILHPRIRQNWRAQSEPLRGAPELFVADIPLLYETGGETLCDRVVVVTCTPEIQLERLLKRGQPGSSVAVGVSPEPGRSDRQALSGQEGKPGPADAGAGRLRDSVRPRNLRRAEAQQIIDAQMPLSEKVARADHVIWNNGGLDVLEAQTVLLVESWEATR